MSPLAAAELANPSSPPISLKFLVYPCLFSSFALSAVESRVERTKVCLVYWLETSASNGCRLEISTTNCQLEQSPAPSQGGPPTHNTFRTCHTRWAPTWNSLGWLDTFFCWMVDGSSIYMLLPYCHNLGFHFSPCELMGGSRSRRKDHHDSTDFILLFNSSPKGNDRKRISLFFLWRFLSLLDSPSSLESHYSTQWYEHKFLSCVFLFLPVPHIYI